MNSFAASAGTKRERPSFTVRSVPAAISSYVRVLQMPVDWQNSLIVKASFGGGGRELDKTCARFDISIPKSR
jgi:hypothetical protein